jgi:hypothetical protein
MSATNSYGLTQEEIDWLKAHAAQYLTPQRATEHTNAPADASSVTTDLRKCAHEWKDYTGFMENYRFCEKCNAKKDHGTL